MAFDTKSNMQEALSHLKKELGQLRSGRANPSMLDSVQVDVYGSHMRLKEIATVTASEPRQLLVTPFDPQTAGPISKGIEKANLNLQPKLEGNLIRIDIPAMDEAMRQAIAKQAKKKGEEAKRAVREVRKKANDCLRKQKGGGEITEDAMKKGEKGVQELTDSFCKEVDALVLAKEKEITTV